MEIAAVQLNIAEYNRWLKNEQYWNTTIVGIFIPDKVMELKPIK
jgi:wobble nucleotide-excising tRNase